MFTLQVISEAFRKTSSIEYLLTSRLYDDPRFSKGTPAPTPIPTLISSEALLHLQSSLITRYDDIQQIEDQQYHFFHRIQMKKYQLWLQRKSYSQHLFNLMKIKSANHSPDYHNRSTCKSSSKQNPILNKYKEMQDYQLQAQKLGDISYAITFKQLKNRKLRLMKSFDILNENMSMARRIKQVKSVFNNKDRNNQTEYGKRRIFQKKCELTNDQLREQNFKKFIKIKNSRKTLGTHKYRFTISVLQAPKILHTNDEFAAFSCEISSEKGVIRSEMVQVGRFQGHVINFPLEHAIDKQLTLKLYVAKGINSEMIGQFQITRPQLGEFSPSKQYESTDKHLKLSLRMSYNWIRREKPSFTLK